MPGRLLQRKIRLFPWAGRHTVSPRRPRLQRWRGSAPRGGERRASQFGCGIPSATVPRNQQPIVGTFASSRKENDERTNRFRRGWVVRMEDEGSSNTGSPSGVTCAHQPELHEGQVGRVAEMPIVPEKPINSGGGKDSPFVLCNYPRAVGHTKPFRESRIFRDGARRSKVSALRR